MHSSLAPRPKKLPPQNPTKDALPRGVVAIAVGMAALCLMCGTIAMCCTGGCSPTHQKVSSAEDELSDFDFDDDDDFEGEDTMHGGLDDDLEEDPPTKPASRRQSTSDISSLRAVNNSRPLSFGGKDLAAIPTAPAIAAPAARASGSVPVVALPTVQHPRQGQPPSKPRISCDME